MPCQLRPHRNNEQPLLDEKDPGADVGFLKWPDDVHIVMDEECFHFDQLKPGLFDLFQDDLGL
jgi:hypothetical protein